MEANIEISEIQEHIKKHLPIMLKAYFSQYGGLHPLINKLIIIPDMYGCEYIKTDLPNATKVILKHNSYISTKKYAYELLSATFDKEVQLTLGYTVEHVDSNEILIAYVELTKTGWQVTSFKEY